MPFAFTTSGPTYDTTNLSAGSEDFEIHLEGVENYRVNADDALSDTEDPFACVSDDCMEADPFASLSESDCLTEDDTI